MDTPSQRPDRQTWAKVAEHLGCSRESIDALRRLPGAPKDKDLALWKEWVEANGHLKGGSRRLTEIKILIAEEELKKKRRENAIADGQVLAKADVEAAVTRAAARMSQLLTQKLENEAPARLVGKDIVETRRELRGIGDELRDAWNNDLEQCKLGLPRKSGHQFRRL